jgi:hypothetical protein
LFFHPSSLADFSCVTRLLILLFNGVLNLIAKHNNILGESEFLHVENMLAIIRTNLTRPEYAGLLEQMGYDIWHPTNYEPNFVNMVFMKNQNTISSFKVHLIVDSARFYDADVFRAQWTDDWNLTGLPGGG